MPNQYDLTGQNIENTYQRVLQTPDGVNIFDGTGSLFHLGVFNNTSTGSYGSFYDTTTQTNPVGNVPRSMSLNRTDISNGVSISGSTDPYNTYIKIVNAGVYNIQFSAQLDKTDSGTDEIVIWLRKNGSDLTDTATTISLVGNNAKNVAAWNWFVTSAANDYYQIIWYSPDTDMRLLAETAGGGHPGIPSVIVTANRVDTFFSNTGSFSGSFIGTHTGSFTGSFTGSLLGTASWANSASQALTASFYQETDPIFVAKSASLATTGSNIFVGNQVVSGSFIIETASSAAALRITQLGSGEAIRVEDSTTPDSTAFIVDSSGSVGIGTFAGNTLLAPLYPIHVIASGGADVRLMFDGKQLGNGAANANITIAADTSDKVASFDFLDRNSVAYNGTATYTGPTVKFLLDRSGSSAPLVTGGRRNDFYIVNGFADRAIIFHTSASDGNLSANVPGRPRLTITGSNVGIGTTTPSALLHVSSSTQENGAIIEVSSSLTASAALRVTQVGSGNAILVEDSTNPDSTPFVVTATGNVGIGLTNPSAPLHTKGQFFLGTGGSNANQGAFNWFTANNTYTFRNSPNGDRGLQIGVNVLLDGAGGTAGAVISPVAATGGAGLVLNGSTLGTSNTTLSSSKDLVITSTGNIGLGINTPQHKLDVSGSARVTSSLFLPGLTTAAQNNVVTVDITTGQLYYTASTAFGGGSSTPTFPYTGSAIISGSLTVTGSISSLNTTASQETFSSTTYVSGDIIQGTIGGGVTIYDLIYLDIDGTWKDVSQTTTSSTKMLGIYIGGDQILIDGNISATTDGVGSPIGPSIQNPDQGLPVYIDLTPSQYNTTIPTTDYVRTLGYVYYNNTSNANNWILKFRPSTDWYKI